MPLQTSFGEDPTRVARIREAIQLARPTFRQLPELEQLAVIQRMTPENVRTALAGHAGFASKPEQEQMAIVNSLWMATPETTKRKGTGLRLPTGRELLDLGADIAPVATATWMGAKRGMQAAPPTPLGRASGAALGAMAGGASSQAMLDLLKKGATMLGITPAGEPPPATLTEFGSRAAMAGAMGPLQKPVRSWPR